MDSLYADITELPQAAVGSTGHALAGEVLPAQEVASAAATIAYQLPRPGITRQSPSSIDRHPAQRRVPPAVSTAAGRAAQADAPQRSPLGARALPS
jgi:hypothetical protein